MPRRRHPRVCGCSLRLYWTTAWRRKTWTTWLGATRGSWQACR